MDHYESEDVPDIHQNVKDSGFFSRDFRVLKNATYGTPNPADMIMKKFIEENDKLDTSD